MALRAGLVEAYQSVAPRMPGLSLAEFDRRTVHFDVHVLKVDGSVCGALMVHGNEIHACVLPWAKGRWFSRHAARVLNGLIDQFGEVTTSATTQDGRRFVLALGFEPHGGIYRSNKKWVSKRSSARPPRQW
jgi:hypothetical protein